MVGAGIKLNVPALVTVPPGVVMDILPVVDPAATTALTFTALTTVKETALVPLNFTAVAPVKLLPLMVTVAFLPPLVGVNEVIVGAARNTVELVAVPPKVVTVIAPEVAPAATTAVRVVLFTTVKDAAVLPLNFTAVAPEKFAPIMVTTVPTGPQAGAKLAIVGIGATINAAVLIAVPPAVVTVIFPVVVPVATVAVIFAEFTTV